MSLLINLYGGPGTGKSTTCAGVFHELKQRGINCEMALEYAKDKVWEGSEAVLHNQLYVFGKQYHRVWKLLDKVDVVITDSPLLMSVMYYQGTNPYFSQMVLEEHRKLDNLNVWLIREKPYNPSGRLQTEEEARLLDYRIKGILDEAGENYYSITADKGASAEIVNLALGNRG